MKGLHQGGCLPFIKNSYSHNKNFFSKRQYLYAVSRLMLRAATRNVFMLIQVAMEWLYIAR
jgi:hypothetical protein